jgi:hypothetical protein
MKRRALLAAPLALLFGAKAAKAPLQYEIHCFTPDQYAMRRLLDRVNAKLAEHQGRIATIMLRKNGDVQINGRLRIGDAVLHSTHGVTYSRVT